MSADRLDFVETIFHDALERPTKERATYVREICDGDELLHAEVLSLLRARSAAFLQEPLVERLPEPPPFAPGERLAAYEILGVLGRGGMGIVYEARQTHPRRKVALKVLARGGESTRAAQRFENEAETLVRIDHPDIAHVYECGVERDRLWLALELVESAQDLLSFSRSLDLRARLLLFARIARILYHGHLKGVVHCDVKPANLLVRPDGHPKVIDFGIARVAGAAAPGLVVGTPGYMSPEQEAGHVADVRTDVFALGVVLFQLLTGKSPEQAGDPGPGFERDLRAIVVKALAPDLERRYQSALKLADDLERFLAHAPVSARTASWPHLLRLFTRRHVGLTISLGLLAAVLITGIVVSLGFAVSAERARREERVRTYAAMISAADSSLRVGDVATARLRLGNAPAEHRGWEWRYLSSRLDQSLMTVTDSKGEAFAASVAGDGRCFVVIQRRSDGVSTLERWDGRTLERIDAPLELPGVFRSVFLENDGTVDLVDFQGRLVRLGPGGEELFAKDLGERVFDLFLVGESTLVMGDGDAPVRVRDLHDDTLLLSLGEPSRGRKPFTVRPGTREVIYADGGEVRVHDLAAGELAPFPSEGGRVTALTFDPGGSLLAVVRSDGSAQVWDYPSRTRIGRVGEPGAVPNCAVLGPGGAWLVVGYLNGALVSWSLDGRRRKLWGHSESLLTLQLLPEGRLLSTGFDGVRVWELGPVDDVGLLAEHQALVRDIAYSPDGRLLAATTFDSRACIYDLESRELLHEIRHPSGNFRGQTVAFSPDGETLAVGWGSHVELWSFASGERTPLSPAQSGAFEAAWTRDGDLLAVAAAANSAGVVTLYDPVTATAVQTLPHPGWVRDLAITDDDRRLVSIAYGDGWGKLTVWSLDTYEPERVIDLPGGSQCVALQPGTNVVATGCDESDIHLWDVESGRLLRTIEGLTVVTWELEFSPDGTRLACAGPNRAIRIVDVAHGSQLMDLDGKGTWFWSVVWRPDGGEIAAGSGNYEGLGAEIRLWSE